MQHKKTHQFIFLDNNAGQQLYNSSKTELIKYLDAVNSSNSDPLTQQAVKIYEKFKKAIIEQSVSQQYNKYTPIITSSGSESNTLAIKFIVCGYCSSVPSHIISTEIEHKSILRCLQQLVQEGKITVDLVSPDYRGVILADSILQRIRPETALISIMSYNNETGISNIAEIQKIGRSIQQINKERQKQNLLPIRLHSDCVQSFGKIRLDMDTIGVDMISCSFYKLAGPSRIAALIINKQLEPLIQKHPLVNSTLLEKSGVHGGTVSLSLSAGAFNSLKVTTTARDAKNNRLLYIKLYLLDTLSKHFRIVDYSPDSFKTIHKYSPTWIIVNFSPVQLSSPNTLFFTIIRQTKSNILDAPCGTKIKRYLADNGIIISTASACGNVGEPNYVLNAQGVHSKLQQAVIRVSLCDSIIRYDIDQFVNTFLQYINKQYPQDERDRLKRIKSK